MKKILCLAAALLLAVCCAQAEDCLHQGDLRYVPDKDGGATHDIYCVKCVQFLRSEACTPGSEWIPLTDLSAHYKACPLCERVESVQNHSFAKEGASYICTGCHYSTDNPAKVCKHQGDKKYVAAKDASVNHIVYCAECEAFLGEEACAAYEKWLPNDDNATHSKRCSRCWRVSGNAEAHSFAQQQDGTSVCNRCGYVSPQVCLHATTTDQIRGTQIVKVCIKCNQILSVYPSAFNFGLGDINLGVDGSLVRNSAEGRLTLESSAWNKPAISLSGGDFSLTASEYSPYALSIHLENAALALEAMPGRAKVYDQISGDADSAITLKGDITVKNMGDFKGTIIVGSKADVKIGNAQNPSGIIIQDDADAKITFKQSKENALAAGLTPNTSAAFTIGSSTFVVNGQAVNMDAPAYIQDPGFTMVPVRYVAQAFGIAEENILFGNGTVTIFAGERTISLTKGSNIAMVNGNPVQMGTTVVLKNGRIFAPVGEIAKLLGVNTAWDSATKTATFEN